MNFLLAFRFSILGRLDLDKWNMKSSALVAKAAGSLTRLNSFGAASLKLVHNAVSTYLGNRLELQCHRLYAM